MRWLFSIAVTAACHLLLGWAWGVARGILAGWLWTSGGWWRGAVAVGSVWAGLTSYTIAVATGPAIELHRILAGVSGLVPSFAVPIIIIAVGILIGLSGGLVGSGLRRLVRPVAAPTTVE
jgi:hypothetical protein